jgi:hypothetical protein
MRKVLLPILAYHQSTIQVQDTWVQRKPFRPRQHVHLPPQLAISCVPSDSNTCFCGVRNGEICGYEAVANLRQTERFVSTCPHARSGWQGTLYKSTFSRVWDASAQANSTKLGSENHGIAALYGMPDSSCGCPSFDVEEIATRVWSRKRRQHFDRIWYFCRRDLFVVATGF